MPDFFALSAPVKEDKTIFTAFLEKEEKEQLKAARGNAASARSTNGSVSTNNNKKQAAPKKKKVEQDGKKMEKVSISSAIAQVFLSLFCHGLCPLLLGFFRLLRTSYV